MTWGRATHLHHRPHPPWRAAQSRACWARPPACRTLRQVGRRAAGCCARMATAAPNACPPTQPAARALAHPSAAPGPHRWGRRGPRCRPGLQGQADAGRGASEPCRASTSQGRRAAGPVSAWRAEGQRRAEAPARPREGEGDETSRPGCQAGWPGAASQSAAAVPPACPLSLRCTHRSSWRGGRSSCHPHCTPAARARACACSKRGPSQRRQASKGRLQGHTSAGTEKENVCRAAPEERAVGRRGGCARRAGCAAAASRDPRTEEHSSSSGALRASYMHTHAKISLCYQASLSLSGAAAASWGAGPARRPRASPRARQGAGGLQPAACAL